MRAPFGEGAAVFMRKQLKEWLDLSLNRQDAGLLWPGNWPMHCMSAGRGLELVLHKHQEGRWIFTSFDRRDCRPR